MWSITVHIRLFQYGISFFSSNIFKYDLILIAQDVESEEAASDTSSSTVEEEDKEFCANEEDG